MLASRYLKRPIKERIPGFDLMIDLLAHSNEKHLSCYFLGAKEEVNKAAVMQVQKKYPNVTIAGRHHGYFSLDDRKIVEQIKRAAPDIIFIALGSPRQEKWITSNMAEFPKGMFMGVGGSFDVLAGEVKRAPDSWIKLNLEWFYRLLKQPFRWKRILKAVKLMTRVLLKKFSGAIQQSVDLIGGELFFYLSLRKNMKISSRSEH